MPGSLRSKLLLGCALALALLLVHGTQRMGSDHYLATQRYEDVYYLPPPVWLTVFSLGHREAVADLIWLRSLVYFGDELGHRGQVENLYNYAEAMLSLDPYFKKVYTWVASCALYRTGKITSKDAYRAIGFLERGVRLFPDDGDLAWTLGANYLYELPTLTKDPKEKLEARRKGLEHLAVAVRRGAGPPWLALTTASELGRLGQREQEIAQLEEVYDQISDPGVKAQALARLASLRNASFAEALQRTYEELERERVRDFPYLDAGLFLQVRPKPAFDGRALLLRGFDPEFERFEIEGE